jgi:pyruvate, water dikinase
MPHDDEALTVGFEAAGGNGLAQVGGKGASLARLVAAGATVPPGFTVTTNAFRQTVSADLSDRIGVWLKDLDPADISALETRAEAIRNDIRALPLPGSVEAAIRSGYADICARFGADLPVAVRSSATAEDMPDASFAGQQDTYLWVVGADDVVARVKDCWASLFTARAVSYRQHNAIAHADVLMAVVVQQMVDAVAAGVAMTLDPVTGDRSKIVIDSSFGLGETVVSGEVTPDNFVVDKVMLQVVKRRIGDKDRELVADRATRKAVLRSVESARRQMPSLTDPQLLEVARIAKEIERNFGGPQDIEWAIDRERTDGAGVVLLQARPETVWSRKSKPAPAGANPFATGVEGLLGTLLSPVKVKT